MPKAAVLEKSPAGAEDAGRLRHLVLVRAVCALRGATKAEIATDLAAIASGMPAAQWRAAVEREIEALGAQGLVTAKSARLEASDAGKVQTARFLGTRNDFPRVWSEVRDVRLVAVALGMQREAPKRLKALATVDGLRGAIVDSAYNLKFKGVATPARLREALAAMALQRAFGDKGTTALAGKLGLSAKAGRLLAAQLSAEPRDFGTDTRLIAALAAEHIGSAASDLAGLRLAVLRKFFGGPSPHAASAKRKPSKRALGKSLQSKAQPALPFIIASAPPAPVAPAPVPISAPAPDVVPPALGRPDLPGFASEVRRQAASQAHGWSGDRKAYISHVWRNIRDQQPRLGPVGNRVQVHAGRSASLGPACSG